MSTSAGLISPPNPLATSTTGANMSQLDQPEHRMRLDQPEHRTELEESTLPPMQPQTQNKVGTKLEENGSGSDSGNDVRSPSSISHLQDPSQGQSQSPSNQSNGSSGYSEATGAVPREAPVVTAASQPFFTPYSTAGGASHSFYPNQYPYVPLDMAPYQNYSNIYANQSDF